MNLIAEELREANEYRISTIKSDGDLEIAELSRRNVSIIEAMIMHDSSYLKSIDSKNKKSTAYWMIELKKSIIKNENERYHEIIRNAVEAVDRDNSTHLNADRCGREEISKRILKIPKEKIKEFLYDPVGTNYELIDIISEITHAEKKPRKNISFASKFCHYAAFYLFEGQQQQDNFSIYDNILKKSLPNYLDFYGIKADLKTINDEKNSKGYSEYQRSIDAVIKAAGSKISRNGFDHLVWYYYKGRI